MMLSEVVANNYWYQNEAICGNCLSAACRSMPGVIKVGAHSCVAARTMPVCSGTDGSLLDDGSDPHDGHGPLPPRPHALAWRHGWEQGRYQLPQGQYHLSP